MLVITSELNAEIILFPAFIQTRAVVMHSQHTGSAPHGEQPAGICERRWSPKTWPSQIRKYLLPKEDSPEMCLIQLPPKDCRCRQWKWERAASRWAHLVGLGSLRKSYRWAKPLCQSCPALMEIKRLFTSVPVEARQRQEATCMRLLKIAN